MSKDRIVSNEVFNKALSNEDYIKIMNKAARSYRNIIATDGLLECKMIALWQALKNFDKSCNVKFTSFLYNSVDWECKRKISKFRKNRLVGLNISPEDSSDFESVEIEDCMSKIHPRLRKVLYQRFFKNMTMEEIGRENDYSRETARRYINDGLDKIKDIIS